MYSSNSWIAVSGASVVVNPEIKAYMFDNGDGTYSYSFTSLNSGKLSILVYLENLNSGVYVEIWDNVSLSGAVDKTTRYSNINTSWTSGHLTSHYSVLCSGRYTATLSVPINDTYTIYYYHDDGGRLFINGVLKTSNWGPIVVEESFIMQLNSATKYSLIVQYFN